MEKKRKRTQATSLIALIFLLCLDRSLFLTHITCAVLNTGCVIYQLLSARDMAQRTYISKDQIVYSTDKDLYEQEYEASEWDRRFREIEKKTD